MIYRLTSRSLRYPSSSSSSSGSKYCCVVWILLTQINDSPLPTFGIDPVYPAGGASTLDKMVGVVSGAGAGGEGAGAGVGVWATGGGDGGNGGKVGGGEG